MIVAVFFVIGFVLIACAAIMGAGPFSVWRMADAGNFKWGKWHIGSHGIYYESNYDYDEGEEMEDYKEFDVSSVKKLKLDVGAAEILFTESGNSDIISVTMKSYGNIKKYSAAQDGDVLEIDGKMRSHNHWGTTPKLTIALPENVTLETVDMSIGASKVDLQHSSILCSNFTLNVGAGELSGKGFDVSEKAVLKLGVGQIELEGGKYNELQLDCGIGSLDFAGEVTGDVSAVCGLGEINMYLQAKEEDYNYNVKCGLGQLEINGSTYSNISGSRVLEKEGATKTLKADCGAGEIEIDFVP